MITSLRVKWDDIPLLLENDYEVDIFSDQLGEAIMSKFGEQELDEETKLPVTLEPKRPGAYDEASPDEQPAPANL